LNRFNSIFEPKQITLSRLEQKNVSRVEPAQLESKKKNRMLKNDIFSTNSVVGFPDFFSARIDLSLSSTSSCAGQHARWACF